MLNKACDVDENNVLLFSNCQGSERGYIRKGHAHDRSCPFHRYRVPELLGGEPGMACQCVVMVMPPYDFQ
jgi:hypothetical protein